MLAVPEVVRNRAVAVGAHAWLDELEDLVSVLAREWGFTVDGAYTDGTEAFVAPVTLASGEPAVLKVVVPTGDDRSMVHEIATLRFAAGRGCVALLRDDVERGALLLERLGPSLHDLGYPIEQRHEILCAVARQVWRPAPDCGFPTGAEKGRWLIEWITSAWERLDRPCDERTVEHALACAERRIAAHDDERSVLVHGDVHEWNALQAIDGFKLVDPDGLLAEAEYDLGVMMREDPLELMDGDPYDRALWFAARTGLDPVAIWEWGVVERVSTVLTGVEVGLEPVASQMLATADRIAASA